MLKFFLFFCVGVMQLSAENFFADSKNYFDCTYVSCYDRNPYVSIGGGVVFPSKHSHVNGNSSSVLYQPTSVGTSLFTLPNVKWKNKYQTGFEVYGALGCSLNSSVRAEGEFLYQNFRRKISGAYDWQEVNACTTELFAKNKDNPIHHASSTTNIYALLSNLYFDYKNNTPISLSLGTGIGVAWINSDQTKRRNVLHIQTLEPPLNLTAPTIEESPKLSGTAFAWQVKTCVKYNLYENFSISFNYRLFGTTSFYGSKTKIITNPKATGRAVFEIPGRHIKGLLNNSIGLSMNYQF